jgi:AraC-like DNA-binding protein
MVAWSVPEGVSHTTEVAPHPNVHLACEGREALVHGIPTSAFTSRLEGEGRVFGIKFRAGAFRTFLGAPVSTLRGRRVNAASVFGTRPVEALVSALADAPDEAARVRAGDAFVRSLAPARDPDADLAAALVEIAQRDPQVATVESLARRAGLCVRAVQRLFKEHVGATPKWVIRRYRMHELIERLNAEARQVDWAAVAADLGFFDQSHLIREFRAVFGCAPAEYLRRHEPQGARPRRAGHATMGRLSQGAKR